jgi:membrane-bound lytic murein transglycosylase B
LYTIKLLERLSKRLFKKIFKKTGFLAASNFKRLRMNPLNTSNPINTQYIQPARRSLLVSVGAASFLSAGSLFSHAALAKSKSKSSAAKAAVGTKKTSVPIPSAIAFAPLLDTQMVKDWQGKAALAGVSLDFSTQLLQGAMMQPVVKRYMDPPPAGARKNWAVYKARFTDALRIQKGQAFMREHATTFAAAEAKYGVPSAIIGGIIGVETLYGTFTGNFKLIDVLSTLAFDYPRRAEYFQGELLAFMQLVQTKTLAADTRGSFAGALGLPQFMPSSLQKWGVSAANAQRIDLANQPEDAIMSVASFLAGHTWQRDLPVAFETDGIDAGNAGALLRPDATPAYDYASIAPFATFAASSVPKDTKFAVVELQYLDLTHDYLITTQNFYSIMQYNRSYFYAAAVWYLAKKLGLK